MFSIAQKFVVELYLTEIKVGYNLMVRTLREQNSNSILKGSKNFVSHFFKNKPVLAFCFGQSTLVMMCGKGNIISCCDKSPHLSFDKTYFWGNLPNLSNNYYAQEQRADISERITSKQLPASSQTTGTILRCNIVSWVVMVHQHHHHHWLKMRTFLFLQIVYDRINSV